MSVHMYRFLCREATRLSRALSWLSEMDVAPYHGDYLAHRTACLCVATQLEVTRDALSTACAPWFEVPQ